MKKITLPSLQTIRTKTSEYLEENKTAIAFTAGVVATSCFTKALDNITFENRKKPLTINNKAALKMLDKLETYSPDLTPKDMIGIHVADEKRNYLYSILKLDLNEM